MKDKLHIRQAIIVEGKYDKTKLESFVDAIIIPTHGFSIFTDTETKDFIRAMAAERGIILLTDSDAAGFKIRGFLRGLVPSDQITDIYIPDIFGKEKRKSKSSKEGKLGVEGMSRQALADAFTKAGVLSGHPIPLQHTLTKADFYRDGFYGRPDSRLRRQKLYQAVGFPEHLSVTGAVRLLGSLYTQQEYQDLVASLTIKQD